MNVNFLPTKSPSAIMVRLVSSVGVLKGTPLLFEKGPKIDKTLSVKHLRFKEQFFVKKKNWGLKGAQKKSFFHGGLPGAPIFTQGV